MILCFGCGMDGIFFFCKLDLCVIFNVIDVELWNLVDDLFIVCNFSIGNMKGKVVCKCDL